MIGGGMALKGVITAQQLTTFVLYVELVTYASLNVCDQWGSIMESIGASERVMEFLDTPAAPQIAAGKVLHNFSGKVIVLLFLRERIVALLKYVLIVLLHLISHSCCSAFWLKPDVISKVQPMSCECHTVIKDT